MDGRDALQLVELAAAATSLAAGIAVFARPQLVGALAVLAGTLGGGAAAWVLLTPQL